MKIAAIIENNIEVGGGFTMSVEILLLLQKISRKNKINFIVLNYHKENSKLLSSLDIKHINIKESFFDKFFAFINYSLVGMYFQRILKYKTFLEKKLLMNKVDLAIFVTPSPKPFYLQKLNYVTTVYDICHRDFPEFSEVREFNIYNLREVLLKSTIGQSVFLITESEELKNKLNKQFHKDNNRIVSVPNGPSPFLNIDYTESEKTFFFNKNNIDYEYFFYPAQFWEHKNHIRILQTVKKIIEKRKKIHFIFCGKDKGNLKFLKGKIEEFKLNNFIKILNFVENRELKILYDNCKAVVMPTYFGPTNIPPLDAWYSQVPLIYSKHLASQAGDAALLVDTGSVQDLYDALNKIEDPNVVSELVKKGDRILHLNGENRKKAELELESKILQFQIKKETWS